MKKIIDKNTWARKANYEFFETFIDPYVSITCNVNCKHSRELAKQRSESFFVYYLYAILDTFNQIEEFRFRVSPQQEIVCYDTIDAIAPIKLEGMNSFASIRFPYIKDKQEFYRTAKELIASAGDKPPYSAENSSSDNNLICVSALPGLSFTSIGFTLERKGGSSFPLVNVGKVDENFSMPVALCAHHGFVDGEHLTTFFNKLQNTLDTY
ncbi:MAG: CatA-like O-acetyltransferase [Rikenellaceae bacterium]